MQFLAIPWATACQASLSFTVSWSLLTERSSNHLILHHLLLFLPSVFSSKMALHIKWPKYWNLSINISPSNDYSGLIFFRIDWLDLLAVQGTPQESFPAPHFENISFLALSLLYGPTLASTRDYWKNHSFAYRTLNWQNDVSAF